MSNWRETVGAQRGAPHKAGDKMAWNVCSQVGGPEDKSICCKDTRDVQRGAVMRRHMDKRVAIYRVQVGDSAGTSWEENHIGKLLEWVCEVRVSTPERRYVRVSAAVAGEQRHRLDVSARG